ncbi:replicative DNA helicase [Faecalibaculum rodentium]|uniref:Replicative DNA helicase n=4 Tax=Faecalibaculum rodentium TaxID=1702221 RepID=A0A140DTC5_9FIRM|nr:replicative DNA helicase [Faecalibaculum rodentium]AMK53902.1 primary replicative DNA helicase [Faecalibaculum rodentium]OLU46120.1 replicative DNA helicase [Faecalibaculum rodentium]
MADRMPNAQVMEQSLLGSLLVYPSVMTDCQDLGLQPEEFYIPGHQTLYAAMQDLDATGKALDLNSVALRLQEKGQLEAAGGLDYIIALVDGAVSSAGVKTYIETIQDKYQLRRLIETADEIRETAMESADSLDDILSQSESAVMDVTRRTRGTDFLSSREIVDRVLEQLKELRNTSGITGIKTGYTDLDRMTNGFQRGDLIILAARPAMGKSALALNLAVQAARRNPGAVAVFSLEMPADSIMKRMLSSESRVQSGKLRDGRLSNDEMNRLFEAGNGLAESLIYLDDTGSIKVNQIFSKCRKLKSEQESLSMIVIDYLQLITGSRSDSRQQEVSEISRSLKILAKEMDCPVIALSQLSRKVEDRTGHEPQLSDLRESGSIEQDADIVMFLYRENYYDKDKEAQEQIEVVDLSLAKHRNGAIGRIQLAFEKGVSRFTNYASSRGDDVHAG